MKRFYETMNACGASPNKVVLVERNVTPQGIPLVDPKAVAKTKQRDLVVLASEIQKADNFVQATICSKLQVIAGQTRVLQKQAQAILLDAERNIKLNHTACNFVKQPGNVYHLYKRKSGQEYLSMLSPREWGNSGPPQKYLGSYRFEPDHTWTQVTKVQIDNSDFVILDKLLSCDTTQW